MSENIKELLNRILNLFVSYLKTIFSVEQIIICIVGALVVFYILRGGKVMRHIFRFILGLLIAATCLFIVSLIAKNLVPDEIAGWIIIGFAAVYTFFQNIKGVKKAK